MFIFNVSSFTDFDEMINRNIKITTNISIEKVIYNQSIESNTSITIDMFFFQKQLQQMIDKTLNNYVQRHFFQSKFAKLFDFSKSSKQQNQNDENIVDNIK